MTFIEAVKSVYRKYATFSGRAARSEYWWFVLFSILAAIVIAIVESALGLGQGSVTQGNGQFSAAYNGGILSVLWSLGNLVPSLAVGCRRLHDLDRSGWWLLIGLIPLIGAIVLLVFFCSRGTMGENRFGRDPLAPDAATVFS